MLTLKSFLKFATLSGFGWLLDLAVLLMLNRLLIIPIFYANIISSLLAASMVFLISRKTIHYGQSDKLFGRLGAYIIYTILLIIIVSALMPYLVGFIANLEISILNDALVVLVAKIIVTPPQLLANFFVSRLIARFNHNKLLNQTE